MDATCKLQDSILNLQLNNNYVSRILGTYQKCYIERLTFFRVKSVDAINIEIDFYKLFREGLLL